MIAVAERMRTDRQTRGYTPPPEVSVIRYSEINDFRPIPESQWRRLRQPGLGSAVVDDDNKLFCAGDMSLLRRKCVAVVGSRKVSEDGMRRARRLARELVEAGFVVVSGLAKGVDRCAHEAAIEAGGRTIAVIGTPMSQAYPAEHKALQERIWREHLLITPFPEGAKVFPSNFPERNKHMAAISDGTVIIEASDTSGTLHQARECAPDRLDRHLFILKSVVADPANQWPATFVGKPKVHVVTSIADVVGVL